MADTEGQQAESEQQRVARIYKDISEWNTKYGLGMSDQEILEWVDKAGLESRWDDPALQRSNAACVGVFQCKEGLGNEVAGYISTGFDRYKGKDLSAVSEKIKGADLKTDDEANFLTAFFHKEHYKEGLAEDLYKLKDEGKFNGDIAETLSSPVTAYILHFTPGKAAEVLSSDDSRPITEVYPDNNPGNGKGIIDQNPALFKDVKTVGDFKQRIGELLNDKAEKTTQLVEASRDNFRLIEDYLRSHGQGDVVKEAEALYAKRDVDGAQGLLVSGVASELGLDKEGLSTEDKQGRLLLATRLGVEETQKVLDPANKDKTLKELGIPAERIEKLRDTLTKAQAGEIPGADTMTAGQAIALSTQAAKNAPGLVETAGREGGDKDGDGTPDWLQLAKDFLPILGGMTTEGMLAIALIACACMAMGSSKDGADQGAQPGQPAMPGVNDPQIAQTRESQARSMMVQNADQSGKDLDARFGLLRILADSGTDMNPIIAELHQGKTDALGAAILASKAFDDPNKSPQDNEAAKKAAAAKFAALSPAEKESTADFFQAMQMYRDTGNIVATADNQPFTVSLQNVLGADKEKLAGLLKTVSNASANPDAFVIAPPTATPAVAPPPQVPGQQPAAAPAR
ncbi:MAG: hypothetical protein U1E36_01480 [Rickettsiales bacterium]